MLTNIESFNDFETDQQIAAHQSGLIRVILEGKTDVMLFSNFWFSSMLDTFDFIEANRLVKASGCTAVRTAVEYSISKDYVPAVGIIDRDSLFRELRWNLLFGIDDEEFETKLQSSDIYVASLWEIEAYILEPDLLARWVSGSHKNPPGSQTECNNALTKAIAECNFLLGIAHYFAAAHAGGISVSDSLFRGDRPQKAQETCSDKIAQLSTDHQTVAAQVATLIARVKAHLPADNAEQLLFLLRYVDTKRLLLRLFDALSVRDNSHWTIPNMQALSNRRPAEFEIFLRQVGRQYTQFE